MSIVYATRAIRALVRMPPDQRARIVAEIEAFDRDPASFAQVTALKGRDGMRLRVGDYRVIFTLAGGTLTILDVGHRREVYGRE